MKNTREECNVDFEKSIGFIEASLSEYPKELQELYKLIMDQIKLLGDDKEVPNFDFEQCKRSIRILVSMVLEGNTSGKYGQFLEGFIELVFNWNNNLKKDEDIFMLCKCSKILLASSFSISRASDSMRQTLEQLYIYKGWLPPAYDLSIPYLNALLDEAEGKQCNNLEQNKNECCR